MKKIILFNIIIVLYSSLILSAQERQKDTLYFELNGKYIFESKYVENSYLLEDSSDIGRGTFFFEKTGTEINNVKPIKIIS